MARLVAQVRADLGRLGGSWERFWFAPRSLAPLAFVRIALGLTIALWGLSLLPDAQAFLGPDGVLPDVPEVRARFGLLQLWRSGTAATVVVALLVPAGLAVAVGLWTRAASIVSFLLLLSVSRRDPYMMNSGDALLRHATFFLACTPAGRVLSVDRWRTDRARFWQVPRAAPWGQRLLQVQLTFVYLFSSFEKLRGEPWTQGTALADAWRITDLARFGVPLPIYDSLLLTNVLTFATLVIEVALALLIWNRRARLYVVLAGIALHLGIEVTMAVGFFSTVAVSLYLAFTPEETAERWLAWLRRRLSRSRLAAIRRFATAGGELHAPSTPSVRSPARAR